MSSAGGTGGRRRRQLTTRNHLDIDEEGDLVSSTVWSPDEEEEEEREAMLRTLLHAASSRRAAATATAREPPPPPLDGGRGRARVSQHGGGLSTLPPLSTNTHTHTHTHTQPPNQRISKSYLDRLLMNYFIVEGHKEVAAALARESGIPPPVDLSTISERVHVRDNIMQGHISQALDTLRMCGCVGGGERPSGAAAGAAAAVVNMEEDRHNERGRENGAAPAGGGVNVNGSSHMSMSSEEGNKRELFFKLQVQKLVEMVREGKVEEALAFARAELAVLGESEEGIGGGGERLKILEEAMTLLVFGAASGGGGGGGGGGEKGGLLDLAHRASLANEANAAILQSQGQDSEPVLVDLARQWQVMVEEMSKGR